MGLFVFKMSLFLLHLRVSPRVSELLILLIPGLALQENYRSSLVSPAPNCNENMTRDQNLA